MTTPRKQITDLDQLAGKTFERAGEIDNRRRMFLVFTDCTFAYIDIVRGWESGDETVEIDNVAGYEAREAMGVLTPEEIAAHERQEQERIARAKVEREANRRATYEKLKAEFEEPKP